MTPVNIDANHPRGTVMVFTMIILVLMALLGAALFLNTNAEVRITQNTYQGRSTFSKADAVARLGVLFSRSALTPSAGAVGDYLSVKASGTKRPPFEVDLVKYNLASDDFNQLIKPTTIDDIRDRYLRAAGAAGYPDPTATLRYGDQVVGTVTVDVNLEEPIPQGSSLQEGNYDQDSGSVTVVYLIVAADGRLLRGAADQDEDAGNYFSDNLQATHSIVNVIFREVL